MKRIMILLFFLLSGCTLQPQSATVGKLSTIQEPIKPVLQHIKIKEINSNNKKFYYLDKDNITIIFNNLSALQKYISEQHNTILFYEDEVNDFNKLH